MNAKWNNETLPEAVRRYNAMIAALNSMIPEVCLVLNGARITADKVDKRTRDKVRAIIEKYFPMENGERALWARFWLGLEYSSAVYLDADISSSVGPHTVDYAKVQTRLAGNDAGTWEGAEPVARELVTVEGVKERIQAANDAREAEDRARDIRYRAEVAAYPFINN
jgi:hypothetical protein